MQLLQRIVIREIPPLKTDLKEHEPTIWGFCRIPQLSEFDDTYQKNRKTFVIIKLDNDVDIMNCLFKIVFL